MRRLITFLVVIGGMVSPSLSVAATGISGQVDFESPSLSAAGRLVIDPYIDLATGVVFTADPLPTGQAGEVELIKNSTTSACVDPASDNQLLGTRFPGSSAFGVFPIRATFPAEMSQPVEVSVDVQTLAGESARIRLFDSTGTQVGQSTAVVGPAAGTCGNPGTARARMQLTASSNNPVAYAVIDIADNSATVFVIDDFVFSAAADSDHDGVLDSDDLCPGTDLTSDTNSETKRNRLWSNAQGMYLYGDGEDSGVTVVDTGGCSAAQVIEAADLGRGHTKFGISKGAMAEYLASLS